MRATCCPRPTAWDWDSQSTQPCGCTASPLPEPGAGWNMLWLHCPAPGLSSGGGTGNNTQLSGHTAWPSAELRGQTWDKVGWVGGRRAGWGKCGGPGLGGVTWGDPGPQARGEAGRVHVGRSHGPLRVLPL